MAAITEIGLIQHRAGKAEDLPDNLEANEIAIATDTGELFFGAPNNPLVEGRNRQEGNQFPYENVRVLTEFSDHLELIKHQFVGNTNTEARFPTIATGSDEMGDAVTVDGAADIQLNGVPITLDHGDTYLEVIQKINSSNSVVTAGIVYDVQSSLASVQLATDSALPAYTQSGAGVGATLTADANGALTIDGVSPSVGDRILVKNGASNIDNGVYVVSQAGDGTSPWILTRATDADEASEIDQNTFVYVQGGTANSNTWFKQIQSISTVDTDNIEFSLYRGVIELVSSDGSDIVIDDSTADTNFLSVFKLGTSPDVVTYSAASVIRRPIQEVFDDRISAKAYGVQGDGSQDDSTKINFALQNIYTSSDTANYRKLYFPAGVYYLNKESMYLPPNCYIVGDGRGRTIFRMDAGSKACVRTMDGDGIRSSVPGFGTGDQPRNIVVQDVTIEHTQDEIVTRLEGVQDIEFIRTEFKASDSAKTNSILIRPELLSFTPSNIRFTECVFSNAYRGIESDYQIAVNNCYFDSSIDGRWISIDGENSVIRNSRFIGQGKVTTDSEGILIGSSAENSYITDNIISDAGTLAPIVIQNTNSRTDYWIEPYEITTGTEVLKYGNFDFSTDTVIRLDVLVKALSDAAFETDSGYGVVNVFLDASDSAGASQTVEVIGSFVNVSFTAQRTTTGVEISVNNSTAGNIVLTYNYQII